MLSKLFTSIHFTQENDCIHSVFKAARGWGFFLIFEHTPPSISPQLPLKHNQCLPTRLPSISCLVTTSPLLSTTKCVTNSELNLEMPLIYPPDWIDRRSLCSHSSIFLVLKSEAASRYCLMKSVPR